MLNLIIDIHVRQLLVTVPDTEAVEPTFVTFF